MQFSWTDPTIPNQNLYRKEVVIDYAGNGNPEQTLTIRRPIEGKNLPVILWLHGGGLTAGKREFPSTLYDGKRIIIEARYRLSPNATPDEILDDAARAIVWTLQNIDGYGGNPRVCFYGGMSAGCYLAAMTAFHSKWTDRYDTNLPRFAGLILLSGQYTTHFHVKTILHPEHPTYLPLIDEYAPMNYLSKGLPPMILVSGEPGLDMPARPEENAFVAASLKALGHPDVEYVRLPGCGHFECLEHGGPYLVRFMQRIEANTKNN